MITNIKGITALLSPLQMRQVAESLREGGRLSTLAEQWEFESENALLEETARMLGVEWLDAETLEVQPEALDGFPLKLVHRYEVFPLQKTDRWIRLAVSNPFSFDAFDTVATAVSLEVRPVLAPAEMVRDLIKRHLGVGAETIDGLIAMQRSQLGDVQMLEDLDLDGSEDAEAATQASVVRLVNEILSEAISARASDIHIEAQEHRLKPFARRETRGSLSPAKRFVQRSIMFADRRTTMVDSCTSWRVARAAFRSRSGQSWHSKMPVSTKGKKSSRDTVLCSRGSARICLPSWTTISSTHITTLPRRCGSGAGMRLTITTKESRRSCSGCRHLPAFGATFSVLSMERRWRH